ncbi:MAG: DUF3159 domain-containing protein [Chloroflexota bacterium]|nr:DUF3159 domain-containing protein [Chloroflexota bacterium]
MTGGTDMSPRAPRIRELLPSATRALGRFGVAGVLPILAFYVAFRIGGPIPGIACGMGLSLLALLIQLRRLGRLDPIVLVPMVLILIQGTAALLTGSVDLYLAVPAVENALWGVALVGSVLLRRPLVRVIAGELQLIPVAFSRSESLRRALSHVTLAWGVGAFVKAGARLWMLSVLPLEPFLVATTVFYLVVNGALVAFSFWWPLRTARVEQAA